MIIIMNKTIAIILHSIPTSNNKARMKMLYNTMSNINQSKHQVRQLKLLEIIKAKFLKAEKHIM